MTETTRPAGAGRYRTKPRQSRYLLPAVIFALAAALGVQAWLWTPAPASAPREQLLEDLEFRVEYLLWKEVARAQLKLTGLGAGRYRAEISGEPMGMLKVLTGQRRDSYQTEMIWRQGKLVPLVYREESRKKGKRHLKEYRFDYEHGRLEMWQLKESKGNMVCKWDTVLQGPVSDPLSAFYNCRLGLMGPVQEGATFKVKGIPYPKPEEIEVRIGAETEAGRKIMISISNQAFENDRGVVFAYLDESLAPKRAWTDVVKLGTIKGELLPGGKPLNGGLPEVASQSPCLSFRGTPEESHYFK
jgi:hypothetical protein